MQEGDFLKKCLERIERKQPWGPRKEWTTYNFSRLSQEIQDVSGVALSTRTLRRLCTNVRNYKPQIATKNALAEYLGFADWEAFKLDVVSGNSGGSRQQMKSRKSFGELVKMTLRSTWFYVLLGVAVLLVLFIANYQDLMIRLDAARVEFTSNYEPGPAPQRVTFYYDVSRVRTSDIFINENFYDDGEIIPVNKNRHYFTTDFELPDHYSVKVLSKGERLSCIRVHVVTNGWEGVINDQHVPEPTDGSTPGLLSYPMDTVQKYTRDGQDNLLEFRNIREFGLMADDMVLETELRNLPDSLFSECLETTVQIINLHGRVGFDFVKPQCPESMLNAEFGDVLLNGEFQDLGAFYQDFTRWRKVRIAIRDKHIRVFLESEEIYAVKYTDPLDEVKGIAYKFKGLGEVRYVRLFDESGTLVYEDTFD